MNEHHRRIVEEEQKRIKLQRKRNTRMSRLILAMGVFCFSLSCLVGVMVTIDPLEAKDRDKQNQSTADITPAPPAQEDTAWMTLLVNRDNYLPADFTVDLKELGSIKVDYRIADALQGMIDAAALEGIVLTPCSGYRNVAEQRILYDNKCAEYAAAGYAEEASKIYANQHIQPPGASEHHTGLAVDFLTPGISALDEGFGQSPAYQWLVENAAAYGFIERYPYAKEKVTGILWEPWHFRYVGQDNAKAIVSTGLCLEEYV